MMLSECRLLRNVLTAAKDRGESSGDVKTESGLVDSSLRNVLTNNQDTGDTESYCYVELRIENVVSVVSRRKLKP